MALGKRRLPLVLPRYSLTGDLLSFQRCALQYRYLNGSKLPPSRPVQLWFGEFVHGVLEMAYRHWRDARPRPPFPWPEHMADWRAEPDPSWPPHDIGRIGYSVEQSLRAQGKNSRDRDARQAAYRRVFRAINDIGPHLFPLVVSAEERILGTRVLGPGSSGRAERYELHGIVDVLTNMTLGTAHGDNLLGAAIAGACPGLRGDYEVIVDYKGSRRPDLEDPDRPYWQQGEWQVLTYAWLRSRQARAIPVAAGVLIYVNELSPGADDINAIKRAMGSRNSDVLPREGSPDWYAIQNWRPGLAPPELSAPFRHARAIRVIPVVQDRIARALDGFDGVVREIENCVAGELAAGVINNLWRACGDEETCNACDCRYFCPDPAPRSGTPVPPTSPPAP